MEPSRQSEAEMNAITENIRRQIDIIVNKLHELVYNLVQKPEAQHEVLYWFGICLSTNTARFQVCDSKNSVLTLRRLWHYSPTVGVP